MIFPVSGVNPPVTTIIGSYPSVPVFRVVIVIRGCEHGPLIRIVEIYAVSISGVGVQPADALVNPRAFGASWQTELVAVLAEAATDNPSAILARVE